ncbi:acyl--CoA ligase [Streptomyces sp. NBC_00193]|uniref:AMP-binding protein n=1 Tax=Streptomyces sp. NBC_00193 TaxID=2975675 RepID=UPI00225848AE|nr:class I adenylate-forming enzyme family protein [Streptomyces sp. NBC_00193]MCX5295131.1 acyl--CoA ligase [Streptomyces sp. NBC_00193]
MLDRLDHALRARPERPAVLTATRTGVTRTAATRGELAELADAFAAALYARGLRAGDTVGVAVRPGPRALAVLLALWRLGLRGAVLDPGAGPDVLRARLASARPALVLADAAAQAVAGWARPLARRAAGLELPELAGLGAPVATVGRRLPGCAPALDRHAARSGVPPRFTGDGDADAVIVFTSGTTARPRAVVHTRASLAAGMETVSALFSGGPGDAAAATAGPVLGGTFFVLVPSLVRGAPVALPARSPRILARQLARLAPRDTYLTPPQLRDALREGARFRGRVWTGSAPAGAELLGRVRESGADEAWGVYALTELFPAAAVESREKAAYEGAGDLVGAPLPGVRAESDADGQLLLTGPGARHRYLGEDPDPWVRTGDRARLDGTGRIVLEGRAKDMVLRRAENIYPGLYEPALHVPGVELALLVGVPADAAGRDGDGASDGCDHGDERLVAVVQPCHGTAEPALRSALAGPLRRMGTAAPDALLFARIPLSGRSRKPDRAATAALAAHRLSSGSGSGSRSRSWLGYGSWPGSGSGSGSARDGASAKASRARRGAP